jgi:hypothetical protein
LLYWSVARFDLGLTEDEFFSLTERQLHALIARFKAKNEKAELLFGIQTAVLANHSFSPPKKAYQAFDFMPSKVAEREKSAPKPKPFSRKKFADDLRAKFKAMCAIPGSGVILVDTPKTVDI